MTSVPTQWRQYKWVLPKNQAQHVVDALDHASMFEQDTDNPETLWHVSYDDYDGQGLPDNPLWQTFPAQISQVVAEDWVAKYHTSLAPLSIQDFYIHTAGHPPSSQHRWNLCIDAGMAFGSGHHETTQGCLHAVQDIFRHQPWQKALDWGCGSGILTLAMNCLQPHSAMGMDNDSVAIQVAQENATLTDIPTPFFVGATAQDAIQGMQGHTPDLIVANLFSHLLGELAPSFPHAQTIVLSGMLDHQAPLVQKVFETLGWRVHKIYTLGHWVTLWMIR